MAYLIAPPLESVIAVDNAEHVLFANASAGRVFGFNAKNVDGLSLLEAVRSHELRAVVQKAVRSRELCSAEMADDRRVREQEQRLGDQGEEGRHRETEDLAVVVTRVAHGRRVARRVRTC